MKKRWILFVAAVALAVWVLWGNRAVQVNAWTVESSEIPDAFDGFRIAQISDLHNAEFGQGNERLLERLMCAEPDIIVFTGDLIDSTNTRVDIALDFAAKAVKIAPCYYVSGNHESRTGQWQALRQGLLAAGVRVLEDEAAMLERDGESVVIAGLRDPDFGGDFYGALGSVTAGEGYTILLSHRPERMDAYAACGADLVFSGHAHGGQFRIPFVGGVVAPHQGWFPEFDSGLFYLGDTVMLVSRGLGNSIIPLRINNRPEIILAVLKAS